MPEPDPSPPPVPLRCHNPSCRHEFGTTGVNKGGHQYLCLKGQLIIVLPGNSLILPCPECQQWRQFAVPKRGARAAAIDRQVDTT